jgi:hypothetical protein
MSVMASSPKNVDKSPGQTDEHEFPQLELLFKKQLEHSSALTIGV